MSLNHLEENLNKILQNKKDQHLFREIFKFPNFNTSTVEFASNDYLNLRQNPEILEAGISAASRSGVGSGASRIVWQTDQLIEELESNLSKHINFKHSIFFPSGFVANVSFFEVLSSFDDVEIFIDHRAHASLFFGLRASKLPYQIFKNENFLHLEQKLAQSHKKIKIIVVESIQSMDGTLLDPRRLKDICTKYSALLFIDESHSFGIMGNHGAGYVSQYHFLEEHTLAISLGCGKAVGVCGGFLATNVLYFKEFLIQSSKHFMFSTGISPFITGAVLKSLELIFGNEGAIRRKQLFANIEFFKSCAAHSTKCLVRDTQIVPYIVGDNQKALKLSNTLIENGMIVKCMRPPSVPRGTSRLRISLKSSHTEKQITQLWKFIEGQDL